MTDSEAKSFLIQCGIQPLHADELVPRLQRLPSFRAALDRLAQGEQPLLTVRGVTLAELVERGYKPIGALQLQLVLAENEELGRTILREGFDFTGDE